MLKTIGQLRNHPTNNLYMVYDEKREETYVCHDIESFKKAEPSIQSVQEVIMASSDVCFLYGGAILVELYLPKVIKDHLDKHVPQIQDPKLKELVRFCAAADSADWSTIGTFEKVQSWKELSISPGMPAGVGFPGKGLSLLCVTEKTFKNELYYLQTVDSYPEGYAVRHTELTPELIAVCKSKELIELIDGENKKEEDNEDESMGMRP